MKSKKPYLNDKGQVVAELPTLGLVTIRKPKGVDLETVENLTAGSNSKIRFAACLLSCLMEPKKTVDEILDLELDEFNVLGECLTFFPGLSISK